MNITETPWQKLNTAPVCFGAKGDNFGSFEVEIGGSVNSVKLVHVAGEVTCIWSDGNNAWSKFGCRKSQAELHLSRPQMTTSCYRRVKAYGIPCRAITQIPRRLSSRISQLRFFYLLGNSCESGTERI